jgi:predicted dehydrogenase
MTGIVVTGAGKIGSRHLRRYDSLTAVDVIGLVEPSDAAYASVGASSTERPRRFSTLEEALDHPHVTVVDICTPTPLHFRQAEAALRAGKSVFCEKPLVTSLADAKTLAAMTGDTTFRVAYPYRYHPRLERLKRRLDEGALGTPHMALLRIGGRGSHRVWKHRRGLGGGVLLDLATHMVDLAFWMFGDFVETEVLHTSQLVGERDIDGEVVEVDAEDVVVLRLRTRSGVTVFVYADFISPGFAHSVEVAGSNGSAFSSVLDALPDRYSLIRAAAGLPPGDTIEAGESVDMLDLELADFVASLTRGEVVQDISSSLAVSGVIDEYNAVIG